MLHPNNSDDGNGDPALTGTVSIAGAARVGETLTANVDALAGDGTPAYQWIRGESTTVGTNQNTYVPVAGDEGSTIKVRVSRAGYTGSITSNPTAIVAAAGADATVNILSLTDKVTAPVKDTAPVTAAFESTQYTSGAIAWKTAADADAGAAFAASTVYKAIVTLTAKPGFTFTGLTGNFTYTGASLVVQSANTGTVITVTITFGATGAADRAAGKTLTITGIPGDYTGKDVRVSIYALPSYSGAHGQANAISGGSAVFTLYLNEVTDSLPDGTSSVTVSIYEHSSHAFVYSVYDSKTLIGANPTIAWPVFPTTGELPRLPPQPLPLPALTPISVRDFILTFTDRKVEGVKRTLRRIQWLFP
ncbi:hypothetical protein AGMMS4952_17210 [Spirochaetia bacterium]|nr:hypothetical protein AGMMS4952_17210 [Spirochaetia bacterium]